MRTRMCAWVACCVISVNSLAAKELTTSLNERVALKKLAEYWEEKDEAMAEAAIRDFVFQYPDSPFCDQLYAMLGDLYFQKKRYPQAVDSYAHITGKEYSRKTAFRYLHSLYKAHHFDEFFSSAEMFLKDPHAQKEEIQTILFELAEASYSQGKVKTEQAQEELFTKALHCYELLLGTSFENEILVPLAELQTFFEFYPQAVKTYLKLAKKTPEREEEFLFHAASLQLFYDKEGAIHTFDRVFNLKGELQKKAGYNLLSLLFQMHRYADVVSASVYIRDEIPEDKKVTIQYYVGKSLFYEKDFEGATELLEELLTAGKATELKEQLVSTLLACSKEMGNLILCDKVLKTLTPDSPQFETALALHSQLSREHKEWTIAKEDLRTLLKTYPDRKENVDLSYDLSLILLQEGDVAEAIDSFSEFLSQYPKSPHRHDALRNLLYLRSLQVKNGEGLQEFSSLLQEMLHEKDLFSDKEQKEHRVFLAQILIKQDKKQEAEEVLTAFVNEYPEEKKSAHAYLLLAHCLQEKEQVRYSTALEKALELDPALSLDSKWHRILFNTYLNLSTTSPEQEKQTWIAKAADHLFQIPAGTSSLDNQRWLAEYYMNQEKDLAKAICVLEKMLQLNSNDFLLSTETERDAMRLAHLYKERAEYQKGIYLLRGLMQEQKQHPNRGWKYSRMAQFELGSLYAFLGEYEQAIDLYQGLISTSSHVSSYFALAAKLELAKLKSTHVDQLQKEERRQQITYLCDLLKEVEVKRQLISEPLHIEAGLYYVDLKTKLVDPNMQAEKKSLLLSQVKKELMNIDLDNSALIDKKQLIEHYIAYIDIQLSSLRKEITLAKTKEELLNLMTHVYNQALQERLTKSVEELDRGL